MKLGRLSVAAALLLAAGSGICQAPPAPQPVASVKIFGGMPPAVPRARVWRVLGDEELRGVSAKGYRPWSAARPGAARLPAYGAGKLDLWLHPMLVGLNGDALVKDVIDGPAMLYRDGSLTLAIPLWVGEFDLQNIRPGTAEGANFGSVRVNAIDLSGTTLTLSPK
ncbi:hypothetical protein AAKU55_003863 [Oxalobacteraceae bacterium GrIS 1.11]